VASPQYWVPVRLFRLLVVPSGAAEALLMAMKASVRALNNIVNVQERP